MSVRKLHMCTVPKEANGTLFSICQSQSQAKAKPKPSQAMPKPSQAKPCHAKAKAKPCQSQSQAKPSQARTKLNSKSSNSSIMLYYNIYIFWRTLFTLTHVRRTTIDLKSTRREDGAIYSLYTSILFLARRWILSMYLCEINSVSGIASNCFLVITIVDE